MATLTSQNGWPVLRDRPPAVPVPGTDVSLTVRPGDVAVVLVEVARRFDDEVEDIDTADHPPDRAPDIAGGAPSELRDDWGWAYRSVRGQTTGFSNHASATAIDLNATQHPRGVKGTFTSAQERAVRAILADLEDPVTGKPVVRWGEDYTTTVDGMHFEINADAAAVRRVADRIRAERRDLLEDLVTTPQERADLIADIAKAVLQTPQVLFPYAKTLYDDADGRMSLFDATQHAAAQAKAGNAAAVGARAEAAAAKAGQASLQQQVAELRALVEALKPPTP